MTTITHTPDGPRFDGMTVGELIAHLTNQSAHLMRVDLGAFSVDLDRAAAALRHLSEWQPIETAEANTDLQLGWWENSPERRWVQETGWARRANSCPPESGASNGWWHGQATHWRALPPGPDGGGA